MGSSVLNCQSRHEVKCQDQGYILNTLTRVPGVHSVLVVCEGCVRVAKALLTQGAGVELYGEEREQDNGVQYNYEQLQYYGHGTQQGVHNQFQPCDNVPWVFMLK